MVYTYFKLGHNDQLCNGKQGSLVQFLTPSLIHYQRVNNHLNSSVLNSIGKTGYLHFYAHSLHFSQFGSVAQSCPTLCDSMDCSIPGLPAYHQLPKSTQTHVHWVGDAIHPSHLSFPPPPAFYLSQYQGLFKWVSSLHQVAKVLEFQLQHQSFQWTFRTDFL